MIFSGDFRFVGVGFSISNFSMGFDVLRGTGIETWQKGHKRRLVLADALGVQYTTQPFQTAEEIKLAFSGDLEQLSLEEVLVRVKSARERMHWALEKHGISDNELTNLYRKIWVYSRYTTPMHFLLERSLADLEGGQCALVFASGMAAVSAVLQQYTQGAEKGENGEYVDGDLVVVIGSIYGGSYACIQNLVRTTGRRYQHLPLSEFEESGLPEGAKMVYFETCFNPTLKVIPLRKVVAAARAIGALTVCDNTFAPLVVRPHDFGIHFVIHSMTKYLNGLSTDLGGCLTGSGEYLGQPIDFHEGQRMVHGGVMSPRVVREFMERMVDMPERLLVCSRHAKSLKEIAKQLGFSAIILEDSQSFLDIRAPNVPDVISNGMVALYLDSAEQAHRFVDSLIQAGVGKGAVSLGATTTYYCIPAETTHSELPADEQRRAGITPGLVRISCGTEGNLVAKVGEVLRGLKE
jgi:methionine-gamma-lyase